MNPDALAARQVGKSSSFQGSRSTTWEDDGVRVMTPWLDPAAMGSTRQRRRQPGGDTHVLRAGSVVEACVSEEYAVIEGTATCLARLWYIQVLDDMMPSPSILGRLECHRALIIYACARR